MQKIISKVTKILLKDRIGVKIRFMHRTLTRSKGFGAKFFLTNIKILSRHLGKTTCDRAIFTDWVFAHASAS